MFSVKVKFMFKKNCGKFSYYMNDEITELHEKK